MRLALIGLLLAAATSSSYAIGVSGQGTWETTLQARDVNSDGIVDAYYDTSLDITWLADADAMNAGVENSENAGRRSFEYASEWVSTLDVFGVSGWRLPATYDFGHDGCQWSSTGGTDCGYNVLPDSSEMAHMYSITLGNISHNNNPGTSLLSNTGPFANLMAFGYWSGTPVVDGWNPSHPLVPENGWRFSFAAGRQDDLPKSYGHFAWAVKDGDVGVIATPVPEPESFLLMSAGLLFVSIVRRRRKAAGAVSA